MINRGQLTDEIKKKSKELLGYEINIEELRLIPYMHYTIVNSQRLNINQISQEERNILKKWEEAKHIKNSISKLSVTKKFWNIMNEILWLSYANYN